MVNGILGEDVERYLDELASAQLESPVLEEMDQRARRTDFPAVGRTVGRFLEQQARAIGARTVLECGSGFGYSAFFFARAVGDGGRVICTDRDPGNRDMAEEFLTHADLWDRIDFRVGDAAEALDGLDGEIDIVFVDADKRSYPDYWRAARDHIRVGGLYLADNTLWYGRAATGEEHPDLPGSTAAIREHNRLVAEDPDFVPTLLPLRDGVLSALRTA